MCIRDSSYLKLMLLASVQGVCFGLATTAGITVAIDITTSTRRSACLLYTSGYVGHMELVHDVALPQKLVRHAEVAHVTAVDNEVDVIPTNFFLSEGIS